MRYAIQWLRSLIFTICVYIAMLVLGIIYLPAAIASKDGAVRACHTFCRWVRWSAAWMVGLKTEIRGTPPTEPVMLAAKHQSFLDVIMIYGAVPRGKFIMKRLLTYAPILGWFALRVGCVPVDRGKRGKAIRDMLAKVKAGKEEPGQLIIYPQGTRVNPGIDKPYKQGTAALYQELGQPCIPVACNVGVFWPKRGIYRKQGTAVVEFMEPIPPGLAKDAYLKAVRDRIENQSNLLAQEAGFFPHE